MNDDHIQIEVKFFAAPREVLDTDTLTLALPPGATVATLLERLVEAHPALKPYLPSLSVAVNRQYADRAQALHEGDVVACLPPVAGG
ncbi:MAG: MoaD/ThiS family protein [Anaerolineae bacterium]